MVTPPSCPGLNVEVIVDGQSLQEYDEIDEGPVAPNTVTKYIEARSNAYFAVRVRINDDFPFPASDLELKAKIDQQHVSRGLIAAKYLFDPRGNFAEGKKVHLSASNDVLHKFRFIALDLVEDNNIQIRGQQVNMLASVGTISVNLQFARNARLTQPNPRRVENRVLGRIPEKALKGQAKSHQVSLGPPVPAPAIWWDYDLIGSRPFVTVNFKYCSLAALRALHIIPREPTPLPLEEKPEDELTPEELLQVVRTLKKRDAGALKIKKEAVSKRARSSTIGVDSENEFEIVEAPPRKRRRGDNEEVIVLD